MSFFESLLALLLAAILLLQVSRRVGIPYPAMLAAAGVAVALIPGAPTIRLDPHLALALFIAPALVDAGFDFPVGAVKRLWRPLFALAVLAVLLTAGTVAAIGVTMGGLPLAAALALGAIVAPPDAAAATATLTSLSMPPRTVAVLKGESLLNDATALLLFSAAVAVQANGGMDGGVALQLGIAAPGGVLLGVVLALAVRPVAKFVSGTLGGNLLEFVNTFLVWILAERLHLSAVLCVVAFAMTSARTSGWVQSARARVHSFSVWGSAVFLLNVLAFLLMGMQARTIVAEMPAARLGEAAGFAALVVVAVIATRMVWVVAFNRLAKHVRMLRGDYEPATLRQGILVGWSGMRGLVTLATAFALPQDFPARDLIVLTAFGVVLATLVIQGLTLGPLTRLLKLDHDGGEARELDAARVRLSDVALGTLEGRAGAEAEHLRHVYTLARDAHDRPPRARPYGLLRALGLEAVHAQREALHTMRAAQEVTPDGFIALQEELDWKELVLTDEEERQIEES